MGEADRRNRTVRMLIPAVVLTPAVQLVVNANAAGVLRAGRDHLEPTAFIEQCRHRHARCVRCAVLEGGVASQLAVGHRRNLDRPPVQRSPAVELPRRAGDAGVHLVHTDGLRLRACL